MYLLASFILVVYCLGYSDLGISYFGLNFDSWIKCDKSYYNYFPRNQHSFLSCQRMEVFVRQFCTGFPGGSGFSGGSNGFLGNDNNRRFGIEDSSGNTSFEICSHWIV